MHPLFLISQFEELHYQTEYQVYQSNDTLSLINNVQASGIEQVANAASVYMSLHEEFIERQKEHSRLCEWVSLKMTQTFELRSETSEMLDTAQAASHSANQCKADCRSALEDAQHQESLARTAYKKACSTRSRCETDVRNMQARLSSARSHLAYKRTQTRTISYVQNGKTYYRQVPVDTSAEESEVRIAEQNLDSANNQLDYALHQEALARDTLNTTIKRVATCQNANNHANSAIEQAQVLQEDSNHAHTKSKTSLDLISDIEQNCKEISALYAKVSQLCESTDLNVIKLRGFLELEASLVQNLSRSLETFERNSFNLKQALDDKASLLLSFNQPISRI